LTYENPDFGISMRYPADWMKQEDNLVNNAIVLFYAPSTENTTEVNVKVVPLGEEETLENIEEQITNRTGFESTGKTINSSRTILNGLPAIEITFYEFGQSNMFSELFGNEPTTKKGLQIWTLDPETDISYGITYLAPPSKFVEYLPLVRQMVSTLQISDRPVI
jgi:hypothetical protein